MDEYCFICDKKLGWLTGKYELVQLESKERIIPEEMTAKHKLCHDCYDLTTIEGYSMLVLRSSIREFAIKQKEEDDRYFDVVECRKRIEDFTFKIMATIQEILKKELDPDHIETFSLMSAHCITRFAIFWREGVNYYFECPNITLDFKKYQEYILDIYNEYENESFAEDDQIWLVLVGTIFLMSMLVTRNNGFFDGHGVENLNMTRIQITSKFESFLKKFKLPPKSKNIDTVRKSKASIVSEIKEKTDEKNCIECGTKNILKAKFCHECGESLILKSEKL